MAITYTKNKGYGLILAIQAAGHSLDNHDGKWISSNDKAVQAIINSYDPMPYESSKKLDEVNAYFNNLLEQVTVTYPTAEVTSWAKQETDARTYKSTGKSSPLLDNLAEQRGETVDSLCDKIIEKADAYAAVVGNILGKRQNVEKRIQAARTLDELNAITYE